MNGLQLAEQLREKLGSALPVIDPDRRYLDRHAARRRAAGLRAAQQAGEADRAVADDPSACFHRCRPRRRALAKTADAGTATVFVVDDDAHVREAIARRARSRWRHVDGFRRRRGVPRGLSPRPRRLPADRRLSAGHERPRIAAQPARRGASSAGHHDHRQQRRDDGGAGDEGRRRRLHREAGRRRGPARQHRSRARAVARFGQARRLAGRRPPPTSRR